MASLMQLKRKIRTAGSISKATKAMQMIAASKLRHAQESALNARPYADHLTDVISRSMPKLENGFYHPYLKANDSNKRLLLVISPDKGLAGGLIANLIREMLKQTKTHSIVFVNIGKKIEKPIIRTKSELLASFLLGNSIPTFDIVEPVISIIDEQYLAGNVGAVDILYTKFSTVFTQTPVIKQILPFNQSLEKDRITDTIELVEPSIESLIPGLLRHFVQIVIYQSILESFASEQAARMAAMQSATDNANEMVTDFTLLYNKIRQEKITNEILDISSGAFQTQ